MLKRAPQVPCRKQPPPLWRSINPYALCESDLTTIRNVLQETGDTMWNEPTWRAVMLEAPEVWGAQSISNDQVVMRIVAKTAPLRQWEVERELRARVKAALAAAEIRPAPSESEA